MNKLFMNNKDDISNLIITDDTFLKINTSDLNKDINIVVMENVCVEVLIIGCNTSNNERYVIKENSMITINKFCKNCNDLISVDLDGINSKIIYNTSIINYDNSSYKQTISHKTDKTVSNISNRGVNFTNNSIDIKVDVIVEKDSKYCSTNQDNKIINIGCGKNYIQPNLLVDNNFIQATHSAYIGKFKKDDIFYLQSRGISKDDAYQLLIKGFLLFNYEISSDYTDEIIQFIQKNI